MVAATVIFFLSLALIIALFALKFFEERKGARIAEPTRARADDAAREIKRAMEYNRRQLEKLPPEVAHLTLKSAVAGALGAASLARSFENQAHRFADFVSSKRGFQRRETKSDFLKGVSEFRNEGTEEVEQTENL